MVHGLIARIAEHSQQIAQRDQALASKDREILYRQAKIDQLTHEMAVLKRWKFGRSREQLDAGQASLLDETIDADIAAPMRHRLGVEDLQAFEPEIAHPGWLAFHLAQWQQL